MKQEGVIGLVHDISDNNIADVPRLLRQFADEIERGGESPRACVVITEFKNVPLDIQQLGRDCDDMRALGIAQLAVTCLAHCITDYWIEADLGPNDAA